MTDADVCARAARVLRERAEKETPGKWHDDPADIPGAVWATQVGQPVASRVNAAFIATMGPGVAVALADWLDAEAKWGKFRDIHALAVARAVLGVSAEAEHADRGEGKE